MKKKLSLDMSVDDHTYLKMCCAKANVSVKNFVNKAISEAIYAKEDEWLSRDSIDDEKGENFLFIDHNGNRNEI